MADDERLTREGARLRRLEAATAAIVAAPSHGWIQWKGTDVCMDVHCACGELTHVDGEFCYTIRCGACGQLYDVAGEVALVPVPRDEEDEDGRCAPLVSS